MSGKKSKKEPSVSMAIIKLVFGVALLGWGFLIGLPKILGGPPEPSPGTVVFDIETYEQGAMTGAWIMFVAAAVIGSVLVIQAILIFKKTKASSA